jgi:hypothetical protein
MTWKKWESAPPILAPGPETKTSAPGRRSDSVGHPFKIRQKNFELFLEFSNTVCFQDFRRRSTLKCKCFNANLKNPTIFSLLLRILNIHNSLVEREACYENEFQELAKQINIHIH